MELRQVTWRLAIGRASGHTVDHGLDQHSRSGRPFSFSFSVLQIRKYATLCKIHN
jgi:hypothetical protein